MCSLFTFPRSTLSAFSRLYPLVLAFFFFFFFLLVLSFSHAYASTFSPFFIFFVLPQPKLCFPSLNTRRKPISVSLLPLTKPTITNTISSLLPLSEPTTNPSIPLSFFSKTLSLSISLSI